MSAIAFWFHTVPRAIEGGHDRDPELAGLLTAMIPPPTPLLPGDLSRTATCPCRCRDYAVAITASTSGTFAVFMTCLPVTGFAAVRVWLPSSRDPSR
jgi:hypothetical protein